MYLVPSTTNAAEPLTRNRMRALGDVSGDMRHVTQLRISLARFGKHSMLLYMPDQLYTVETVLEATIPFVRATMNAAGWAAESKAGYTLAALFEKQLKHIKWIRKQGDMAVVSLLLQQADSHAGPVVAVAADHEGGGEAAGREGELRPPLEQAHGRCARGWQGQFGA